VADYVKAREALEEISEKMEVSDMNPDQRAKISEHRQQFVNAIKGATDRQIQEAAFDSEEAIDAFFDSHGFSGTSSYQVDENINLVSMERLSIDPRVLETLRPHMRLWLLSAR